MAFKAPNAGVTMTARDILMVSAGVVFSFASFFVVTLGCDTGEAMFKPCKPMMDGVAHLGAAP